MQRARRALEPFRRNRLHMVRQMTGAHWSEEGAKQRVPVNLLSLYVNIVGRTLIPKNPRGLYATFQREHKPIVKAMQDWANKETERMDLANTLQRVVLDALFSIGICKVALATPADAASFSWNLRAGQPFAERVDLDDFVYDIHARDFSEVTFIGHRYRVPLEVVRDSPLYNKKLRESLSASTDPAFNEQGDERIGVMGRGYHASNTEEFEKHVDLWEVYCPRHRIVLTFPNDYLSGAVSGGIGSLATPLREQGWIGPDEGPYHLLGLGTVPGNAMPKGPIQDLIDLHEHINRLARKLMNQAERQKTIAYARGGATEDGDRTIKANDGDMISLANPENVGTMSWGGPDQTNFLWLNAMKDVFSWLAGNLDIMGGLSPQSKTATQDKMLNDNSSRTITDMQDRTKGFTSNVFKSLSWFWLHHPYLEMRTKFSLPAMPAFEVPRQVGPEQRQQLEFEDMDITIAPYSMQLDTPQQKLATIKAVMEQTYAPIAPILAQQGIVPDFNAYLRMVAELSDTPEIAELMTVSEPPTTESTTAEPPGMPQKTERTYNRTNTPGRTEKGNSLNLTNALMGVDGGGTSQQPAMGAA